MELKEILAISGQPGLYKYVAQSTNGVIVESLLDGKRMNASASSKVSALTEISIFTEGDDLPLADVFTNIYNHTGGKEAISHKEAPEKLKAAFAEVLPDYDKTGESGIGASQPETKIIQKTNRQNGRPRILHFDNKKPPASQRTAGTDCEQGGLIPPPSRAV